MRQPLGRRSFLGRIVGGAVSGGALTLIIGPARATPQGQGPRYTGVTDCDTGDASGYGTGERNAFTDSDQGPNADAECHGRGPNGQAAETPSGRGNYGRGEYGQVPTRCSDHDPSDPGGRGVNCQPGQSSITHCTDSDPTDSRENGRHCSQ